MFQPPCFFCYQCQRFTPMHMLRFRRDTCGRNRRVCEPCASAPLWRVSPAAKAPSALTRQ